MELFIRAKRFYPAIGKEIPIAYNSEEKFENVSELNERMRVILIKKGTGIITIDDKRVSIVSPAVLCINETEEVNLQSSSGWEAQAIYFHPGYINAVLSFDKIRGIESESLITSKQDIFLFQPFIHRDEIYTGQLNLDTITLNNISNLMESIKSEIEEQSHHFWSCRARSYFIELLFTLVTVYQSPESKVSNIMKESYPLIEKVILYFNSNYGEKITIPELCLMFHTNKTTLQVQFHAATGQSIMAYLIALRVKLATLMLKDTALSITEISDRLGFSDNAHFNKMFRKLTGYSPIQYRKHFTCL